MRTSEYGFANFRWGNRPRCVSLRRSLLVRLGGLEASCGFSTHPRLSRLRGRAHRLQRPDAARHPDGGSHAPGNRSHSGRGSDRRPGARSRSRPPSLRAPPVRDGLFDLPLSLTGGRFGSRPGSNSPAPGGLRLLGAPPLFFVQEGGRTWEEAFRFGSRWVRPERARRSGGWQSPMSLTPTAGWDFRAVWPRLE